MAPQDDRWPVSTAPFPAMETCHQATGAEVQLLGQSPNLSESHFTCVLSLTARGRDQVAWTPLMLHKVGRLHRWPQVLEALTLFPRRASWIPE